MTILNERLCAAKGECRLALINREELSRRQRALADYGEFVLRVDDLQQILTEGCRLIAQALNTDLAKILEIESGRTTALVVAGVGWMSNIVGQTRIKLHQRSSESYALDKARPVITKDITKEGDSNLHIPNSKTPYEMSREFRTFSRNLGVEIFAAKS